MSLLTSYDSFWDRFGSFWDRFGIVWGPFWGRFGIVVDLFGIVRVSFWAHIAKSIVNREIDFLPRQNRRIDIPKKP